MDQVIAQIVRICHLLKIRRQQLFFRITKDLTERSIYPAPLPVRRDKRHSGRMIEGITEMLLALLQRLADARLLIRVLLSIFDVPAISAIGGVNDSDNRKGDKKRIQTESGDEACDHAGG